MKREALQRRIREVVKNRTPKGFTVIERVPRHNADGMTTSGGVIYVPPLISLDALFVFLHEVGHAVNGHVHADRCNEPVWQHEYEAEAWAIAAMRAEGFRVGRALLAAARANVAGHILRAIAADRFEVDGFGPAAVKFAFPKTWRKLAA
jgi:hypothetical protein